MISSIPLGAEYVDRVIGRIRHLELGRSQRQHPRDIDRDVASADDDDLLGA